MWSRVQTDRVITTKDNEYEHQTIAYVYCLTLITGQQIYFLKMCYNVETMTIWK